MHPYPHGVCCDVECSLSTVWGLAVQSFQPILKQIVLFLESVVCFPSSLRQSGLYTDSHETHLLKRIRVPYRVLPFLFITLRSIKGAFDLRLQEFRHRRPNFSCRDGESFALGFQPSFEIKQRALDLSCKYLCVQICGQKTRYCRTILRDFLTDIEDVKLRSLVESEP